jgi:hypothetical protein
MLKIAWMGSLAVVLLTSGCAVSGPSLFPGFWLLLDSPEEESEQECEVDCSQAKTTAPDEQESAKDTEESPKASTAQPGNVK